jgi:cation:H+ antiporter
MSDWVEVLLGLVMILAGAELLVRGAIALALRLSITPTVIGLTVVAIGTSVPEAVVSFQAMRLDVMEMGVGAILGSNIFNIAAILGITTLINPLTIDGRMLKVEYPFVCLGTVCVFIAAKDGSISQFAGGAMFTAATIFFIFLGLHVWKIRRQQNVEDPAPTHHFETFMSLPASVGAVAVGLVVLKFGGDFAIQGSTDIAVALGWSHRFIGLTILAFGTSAPELAVCAVAAFRKQSDLAIGNIVGSCLFNLMIILGGAAMYRPIGLSARVLELDFPFLIFSMVLLLGFMKLGHKHRRKLRRFEGGILVLGFVAYYTLVLVTQTAG